MSYHLTLVRMAIIKKSIDNKRVQRKWNPLLLLVGIQIGTVTMKTVRKFLKKLKSPCLHACYVASVMSDSVRPYVTQTSRLLCPWDSPGKNTGADCHALLQGIFPTQELIVTICSSNPTPWHTSREDINSKRFMHPNVHNSTIYNSQDMGAT